VRACYTSRSTGAFLMATGVNRLAISPGGGVLAAASDSDRSIEIRNVADGSLRATLRGHNGLVRSMAFSPNGRWLASAGDNAEVVVWDLPQPDGDEAR
jgi:WD40 repeat protein